MAIDKPKVFLGMADCLINLASIDIEFGYYDEAWRQLQEALSLQETVLGNNNPVVEETTEKLEFLKISMGYSTSEPALKSELYRKDDGQLIRNSDQSNYSGDTYHVQEMDGG